MKEIKKLTQNTDQHSFFESLVIDELFTYSQSFDYQEVKNTAALFRVNIEYCTSDTPEYKEHGCFTCKVIGKTAITFDEVCKYCNEAYRRAKEEYQAWNDANKQQKEGRLPNYKDYKGYKVDYARIDALLIQAIKYQGFNDQQAAYIHSAAYERSHSAYGDMPGTCQELCSFLKDFPK